MSELKPCPCCGGAAQELSRFNANVVKCQACGLSIRQSDMGEGDAAERWNRRTESAALSVALAQLEEERARNAALKPVAWVRRHPDGALTNQFLEDATIEPVRKASGAWLPLAIIPKEES